MPKISVITVCYNETDVKRTCDSILKQSSRNYEWLIIDGGSKGQCLETLHSYANKATCFISEKDNGIYDAMNKGIARAKGEYLIFMNAGDVFFHSEVLQLVEPYLNGKNEIVYGDTQYINEDGSSEIISCPDSISKEFFIRNTINHQSAFIKRNLFACFGGYDESFPIFADVEKWLVYKENDCLFKYLPIIIAGFYRTGVSSRYTESYYAEHRRMCEKHFSTDILKQYI